MFAPCHRLICLILQYILGGKQHQHVGRIRAGSHAPPGRPCFKDTGSQVLDFPYQSTLFNRGISPILPKKEKTGLVRSGVAEMSIAR